MTDEYTLDDTLYLTKHFLSDLLKLAKELEED